MGSDAKNDSVSFFASETAQSKEYAEPRDAGDGRQLCDGGGQ